MISGVLRAWKSEAVGGPARRGAAGGCWGSRRQCGAVVARGRVVLWRRSVPTAAFTVPANTTTTAFSATDSWKDSQPPQHEWRLQNYIQHERQNPGPERAPVKLKGDITLRRNWPETG